MQEIEFTKEDEYCIKNFGYNTVGNYEDLKQLEDKEHLIVEELEYRLQQKEDIIKEVRDILKRYICNPSGLKDGWHIDCWNGKDISKLNEDLGILDKENK